MFPNAMLCTAPPGTDCSDSGLLRNPGPDSRRRTEWFGWLEASSDAIRLPAVPPPTIMKSYVEDGTGVYRFDWRYDRINAVRIETNAT